MRRLPLALPVLALALSLCALPARADPASNWRGFMLYGPDSLGPEDWKPLATSFQTDIGVAAWVRYAIAWREAGSIGAFVQYHYDPGVSPNDLPGPGPMTNEFVELTIHCADHTARIHHMYLFGAGGREVGTWFDPEAAERPATYGAGGMVGLIAAKVC